MKKTKEGCDHSSAFDIDAEPILEFSIEVLFSPILFFFFFFSACSLFAIRRAFPPRSLRVDQNRKALRICNETNATGE